MEVCSFCICVLVRLSWRNWEYKPSEMDKKLFTFIFLALTLFLSFKLCFGVARGFKSIWNQHIDSIYRRGLWKGLAESHIFPYPLLNGLNLSVCQNTALQGLQTQQVWDRTHYPCLANTYYYWEVFLQLLLQLLLFLFPLIVSYFPYHLLRRWWIICLWRQLQCYAKYICLWEAERVLPGNFIFYSHDCPFPK